MPVNSKRKGKVGELEAAKYLRSLGFHSARRTVQHNGRSEGSLADLVCDELPGLHIEVKRGGDPMEWRPGRDCVQNACEQANRDSHGKPWCVLYRPNRQQWWCMVCLYYKKLATFVGDKDIRCVLLELTEKSR